MADEKYAFQCRYCGAVEPAEAAGDNPVPSACHICRHGVKYQAHEDGTGFNKIHEPENWIVLADLKPEELEQDFSRHGLKPSQVVRHKPKVAAPPDGKTVITTAQESVVSKDKASAQ